MIGKFSNTINNNSSGSNITLPIEISDVKELNKKLTELEGKIKNPVTEEDIHLITLPYKEANSFLRIPPSRVDNGQVIHNEPLRQQDLNKVLVGDLYAEELFWQPYPIRTSIFDLVDMPQSKEHKLFGRLLIASDEVTIRIIDVRKEYRILKTSYDSQKLTFQAPNGVRKEYNSPEGTLFIVAPKDLYRVEMPVITEIRPFSYFDFNVL